jgi:prepilin-type processing-associated H-X9-DG protein
VLADRPQWYHNDRTGFCFFDGHTELRHEGNGKGDDIVDNYLNPGWFPVDEPDKFVCID